MVTTHANTVARTFGSLPTALPVFAKALIAQLVLILVVLITPSTERDECLT